MRTMYEFELAEHWDSREGHYDLYALFMLGNELVLLTDEERAFVSQYFAEIQGIKRIVSRQAAAIALVTAEQLVRIRRLL